MFDEKLKTNQKQGGVGVKDEQGDLYRATPAVTQAILALSNQPSVII